MDICTRLRFTAAASACIASSCPFILSFKLSSRFASFESSLSMILAIGMPVQFSITWATSSFVTFRSFVCSVSVLISSSIEISSDFSFAICSKSFSSFSSFVERSSISLIFLCFRSLRFCNLDISGLRKFATVQDSSNKVRSGRLYIFRIIQQVYISKKNLF